MTASYYNNMGIGMGQYFNPQQQMSNLINQHPQYFNQAMQQAVQAQPQNQLQMQTQPPIQQPQAQNTITTQPPIMQPSNNNGVKVLYVGNREEAFVHPVDLIYSTPSFFFNRGTNEVYMKQYDGSTGNAIFKVYVEQIKPVEKPAQSAAVSIPNDNAYMDELKMIRAGVEGLYRYFNQPQYQPHSQPQYQKENEVIDVDYAVTEDDTQPTIHSTIKKGVKNGNSASK